jgi:ubiquinone/menaquinone biosynthesis C-methylase UbiE
MADIPINFDDAASYELFMSTWTQLAGEVFLDWVAPAQAQRWLDIGCGSGAFTELIVSRCAPKSVLGIDPSEAQLDYARARPGLATAQFAIADATALPDADASFDIAVMALVLFFLPEPARGVAEMRRVVRPGGLVLAYAWDIPGGGFPIAAVHDTMREMGLTPALPPSAAVAAQSATHALWQDAGLIDVESREITVERSFDCFDDYWTMAMAAPAVAPRLAVWPAERVDELKVRLKARLGGAAGAFTTQARASAVKGRVPA